MTNKTTITLTLAIASILIASPFAIPSSYAGVFDILFIPEGQVPGTVVDPSVLIFGEVSQAILFLVDPDGNQFPANCFNGDVGIQSLELECIVQQEFTNPGLYCWVGILITIDGQQLTIDVCPFEILAEPEPPQVQLTKTCEVIDEIAPGTIEWIIQFANTGDTNWIAGTLDDPQLETLLGNPGSFPLDIPALGPGEGLSLGIPSSGLNAGTYTNQATITVENEFGLSTTETSEEVTCTILPNQIDVEIDIKPGSDPNSINTKSRGVVPVAILGSDSFDVTDVDVTTLTFGPDGASPVHDLSDPETYDEHLQDVNDDGFLDLVSHYSQKVVGLCVDDTEATISGTLLDGTPFEGTDSVRPLHAPDC